MENRWRGQASGNYSAVHTSVHWVSALIWTVVMKGHSIKLNIFWKIFFSLLWRERHDVLFPLLSEISIYFVKLFTFSIIFFERLFKTRCFFLRITAYGYKMSPFGLSLKGLNYKHDQLTSDLKYKVKQQPLKIQFL